MVENRISVEAMEYFDVVDEHDRVIGRQPREIVHRDNLLHRSVHALVYDPGGRLYLQKRACTKDTNPGLWDTSMGGHLQSGEDYAQALARELQEELRIEIPSIPPHLFRLSPCADTGFEFIRVYRIVHDGHIVPCATEIEEGRWVDGAELEAWMTRRPQAFTATLKLILARL